MSERSLPFWLVAAGTVIGQRPGLGGPLPLRWQRRWLDAVAGLLPLPAGTVTRPVSLGGRPALRVSVGATERPRAVLHLHGGAYTVGSPRSHRGLAALLAAASESVVYLPDYRLAPEHPYPAALQDAVLAAEELAEQYPRFAISGDSAGGGLAVATARRLADAGTASPAALALISPWVDPGTPATGPPPGPGGATRDGDGPAPPTTWPAVTSPMPASHPVGAGWTGCRPPSSRSVGGRCCTSRSPSSRPTCEPPASRSS